MSPITRERDGDSVPLLADTTERVLVSEESTDTLF